MFRVPNAKSILALVSLVFLGRAVPAFAAETIVDQHDLMFAPGGLTIAAGDTVRFTDSDRITHNITITYPDGTVEDKGMDRYKEDTIVHFTKQGVYQVHCLIHPMMHMTITVK
jgi:plastocyanin